MYYTIGPISTPISVETRGISGNTPVSFSVSEPLVRMVVIDESFQNAVVIILNKVDNLL